MQNIVLSLKICKNRHLKCIHPVQSDPLVTLYLKCIHLVQGDPWQNLFPFLLHVKDRHSDAT